MRQQVVTSCTSLTQYIKYPANDLGYEDGHRPCDPERRFQGKRVDPAICRCSQRIKEVEITAPANDLRDQRTVLIKQLSKS